MQNTGINRAISFMLSLIMAMTAFAFTWERREAVVYAADPTFTDISIDTDDPDKMEQYLTASGNYRITLKHDISYRIGKKKDEDSPYVETWITLGSGTKIIDLNGYDIKLTNDRVSPSPSNIQEMYMFGVPEGAELVINDYNNSGEINYNGILKSGSPYNRSGYFEQRSLIKVDGGKLTVNGGRLIAGRRGDFSDLGDGLYYQINGKAVNMTAGTTVINGGVIKSRGLTGPSHAKNAAIWATGGNIEIWDVDLIGEGGADVFHLTSDVDIKIYGGLFDVSSNTIFYGKDLDDKQGDCGNINIPVKEAIRDTANIDYYYNKNKLTAFQRSISNNVYSTTARIDVKPATKSATPKHAIIPTESGLTDVGVDEVIEWDKNTPLNFFLYDSKYFNNLRSFDDVYSNSFSYISYSISSSPNGEPINKSLKNITKTMSDFNDDGTALMNADNCANINDLTDTQKALLEIGKTYYVQLYAYEKYTAYNSYTRMVIPNRNIKIKIVEENISFPDITPDFDFENETDTSGKNNLSLIPTGESSWDALKELEAKGIITRYNIIFEYYNAAGTKQNTSTTGGLLLADGNFKVGASYVNMYVQMWKGDTYGGAKTTGKYVVALPNLTTSIEKDYNNRVLAYPSAPNVTVGNDAALSSGMVYTRDGSTVNTNTASFTVNAETAPGMYSFYYIYDGKYYYSDQKVYIGLRTDGERYVNLSSSKTSAMITSTSKATELPTLTASVSGDWGTMRNYYWYMVSTPSDTPAPAIYKTSDSSSKTFGINMATIFGWGSSLTNFGEGTYKIQCMAVDVNGNRAMSPPVSVMISRPFEAVKIYADGKDVTDGELYMPSEDAKVTLEVVLTPDKAQNSSTQASFDVDDDTIAAVETLDLQTAVLSAQKGGITDVTIDFGSSTHNLTVHVPKNNYDVTIPEEYLEMKAGEEMYMGIVPDAGEDFDVELRWNAVNSYGYKSILPAGAVFEGEAVYQPEIIIYPKEGVVYPSVYNDKWGEYEPASDAVNITVNGDTYYSAAKLDYYETHGFTGLPVSQGDSNMDCISLYLGSPEKLIDERDDYIDMIVADLDIPLAGDRPTGAGLYADGCVDIATNGILFLTDGLYEVTDVATTKDDDISNDSVTDFNGTFEAGKTYRYRLTLAVNVSYLNESGGRVRLADDVNAAVGSKKGIVSKSDDGPFSIYTYFKVNTDETDIIGDIDLDGEITSADAALLLKYLSGGCDLPLHQRSLAYVTNDNEVDMLDVIAILNIAETA